MKILVKASDRLIESRFVGINSSSKRPRPDKEHIKFPLYTDKDIGFDAVEEYQIINSVSFPLKFNSFCV